MGVFPATLREQGLDGALQALARDAPIPVHVTAAGVTRHPLEIESAVYFATVEAIQNAMKHAPTTTGVWVDLTEDDALRFEVRDDGPGFTLDGAAKRGLRNMRDRIEAIGGRLSTPHGPRPRHARVRRRLAGARNGGRPADRRGGESPIPELPLYERLLPAVASSVTRVRAELNDALTRWGVAPERLSDVALLLTEAANNVVVHAYSAIAPGPLYTTAVLRGHTLVVSVVDCGSGTLARPGRPGAGLGFSLMTGLADDLRIRSDLIEGGTAVQAAFDHVIGRRARRAGRRAGGGAGVRGRAAGVRPHPRGDARRRRARRHGRRRRAGTADARPRPPRPARTATVGSLTPGSVSAAAQARIPIHGGQDGASGSGGGGEQARDGARSVDQRARPARSRPRCRRTG